MQKKYADVIAAVVESFGGNVTKANREAVRRAVARAWFNGLVGGELEDFLRFFDEKF